MTTTIREFLQLPSGAMPGARFAAEADSWACDAWVVLRQAAQQGKSCESLCGTQIVLRAVSGLKLIASIFAGWA